MEEGDLKLENGVFINGMHHAREPMSVTMCVYMFVKYIYESNKNIEVRQLLSNTVIWFAPIINLDTYEHNYNYYKETGRFSMLRKNRRQIQGCFDLK